MKVFIAFFITVVTLMSLTHVDYHLSESYKKELRSIVSADFGTSQHTASANHQADTCSNCHIGHCPFPISEYAIVFKELYEQDNYPLADNFSLSDFAVPLLRPPIA